MQPHETSILIVEDEGVVALDLESRVAAMGYEVVGVASSGESAIEQALALQPGLILMDIKLTGDIDGVEAADRIRAVLDVPVVFLTAFADEPTLNRVRASEPYGYILKPFDERELQIVISIAIHRHRAMRRIREGEAWLFAVLEAVDDGVLATDEHGRVKLLNPVARRLTGRSDQTALGLSYQRVLDLRGSTPSDDSGSRDLSAATLVALDGSEHPIEWSGTDIHARDGASLGTVYVFRDVTERQRVVDAQRLVADTCTTLAASLDVEEIVARAISGLVPALADWCLVDFLGADRRLETMAAAHADPAAAAELRALPRGPIGPERAELGIGRVLDSGEAGLWPAIDDPGRLARALGWIDEAAASRFPATSLLIVPIHDESGTAVLGALTLAVDRRRRYDDFDLFLAADLGRRVGAAVRNARLYADAQRAVRLREEVLALVSHDLRNPLATVLGHAQILTRAVGASDADVRRHLRAILRSVDRMHRLTADLLDVGKIEAGRLAIETGRCAAGELVEETLDMFAPVAARKDLRLVVPAVCAPLVISCDRNRILQVLANLVANAIKFSPDGGTIGLGVERVEGQARFYVEDHGSGIEADQIEHVFERYWQAPAAVQRGTGLGLYIAKGIVEAHGGRIWVESVPGGGSTFLFTLELADAPLTGQAVPHEEATEDRAVPR